jgi:hypothetical protein
MQIKGSKYTIFDTHHLVRVHQNSWHLDMVLIMFGIGLHGFQETRKPRKEKTNPKSLDLERKFLSCNI